jgi:hypothetical protein
MLQWTGPFQHLILNLCKVERMLRWTGMQGGNLPNASGMLLHQRSELVRALPKKRAICRVTRPRPAKTFCRGR